ncbi:N/A [soil metagenome]|jgi:ferredoxin
MNRRSAEPRWLRIDPVACDGIGICSHLAPDVVRLDSWGFPILPDHALRPADRRAAEKAVTGCPRKALFIDPD